MSDPRRRLCLSIILSILGCWVANAAPKLDVGAALASPHAPGEMIIRFLPNAPSPARLSLMTRWNATSQQRFASGAEHWVLRDPASLERALRELSSSPLVAFAEPNYRRSIELAPNDPYYTNLYGLKNTGQTGGYSGADIDAESAWDVTTGDHSVLIAVSDTGVDRTHPDLAANIWTNPLEIPNNGIDDDQNGYIDDVHGWDFVYNDNDPSDFHSHGTHVAGTIGAAGNNGVGVVGVNWNVSIVPVKILGDDGYGYDSSIIAGLDYAARLGVTAINASWGGGGYSTGMMEAIRRAGDAGVLFIAAAGNYSSNNDYYAFYPATYNLPNIVAVAATDHYDRLAYFSNYGATTVDLGAPGVDTYSTLPSSSYGYKSGTSMAAPHVTGVAALIKSIAPDITMSGLRTQLLDYVDQVPALSGITVTGGRLDARAALGAADSLPPSQIVDLSVESATSNSVVLTWTAPGGNGNTGRAANYELRYALAPIDDTSFDAATLAPDTPRPSAYGSNERFEVTGLAQSATYYFAIKSRDEWGNQGLLSNVPSTTTLGPPTFASSPDSFTVDVLSGESTQRVLTIQNAGVGSLDWQASISTPGGTESAPQEPLELAKGETDPRKGPPAIQQRGGPDNFGYRYIDSDDPTGPAFSWSDISTTGQAIAGLSGDDQVSEPIAIGFPFRFYGVDFEQVRVSTNGFLSFTSNSTAFTNQPLPNPAAPEYLVAPFWDDLSFDSASRVWYLTDGQQFTVQFSAVRGSDGSSLYTFQVSLYADGTIAFRYLTMSGTTTGATIGIQDGTRLIALPIAFNTSYVRNSFAVEIAAAVHWISVQPLNGRAWAGESSEATLIFDARQLDGGTYDSSLVVTSNDPLQPLKNHPVRLHVSGAPDLRVLGVEQRVVSTQSYYYSGASTSHHLAIDPAVANGGMLLLTAAGDYGNDTEQATVVVEGESLGSTAPMGVDCAAAQRSFPLSDAVLQRWASDGVVDIQVSNSSAVDTFCTDNRHRLELSYRMAVDRLDFEPTYILGSRSLTIELRNAGTDPLVISSIQSNSTEFVPSRAALTLAPRQRMLLGVDFHPADTGLRDAQLTLASNDPDTPVFTLGLSGLGLIPPDIQVAPLQFQFDLLTGATETRALQLDNLGGDRLDGTLLVVPPAGAGATVSRFQGLSRGEAHAMHNGVSDEVEAGAPETAFVPAERVFKQLNPSPYAVTCVVADPLTRAIYAQRFLGNNFYRFNTTEGLWQELAPSPLTSGNDGGAALLNGKIYTSYADNSGSMGVYDIAANSWTTVVQPLGTGTTNITSDGTSTLYLAYGQQFLSYDPSTGQTRPLAAPPFSFERWGALVYRHGVIFGLQGNNRTGLAKYSTTENAWTQLASLPAGVTLGATFDESRNELVAVGPYGGNNYYSFNLTSGQWSVSSIPFFFVDDGGLAFLPSLGVYFAQGESGTGFALAAPVVRWLSVLPSSVTLEPQQSLSSTVSVDASGLFGGLYQAEIRIESNDPDESVISIPVSLSVTGAPDIRVLGQESVTSSTRVFSSYLATTDHLFPVGTTPFVRGELVVEANGDFGASYEFATVQLEGTVLGRVGGVGSDCTPARGIFLISPELLELATQDGTVNVSVTNTSDVDLFCSPNQHTVQLRLRRPASSIAFGSVFVGNQSSAAVEIVNQGTADLLISSLELAGDAFHFGSEIPKQIPPGESVTVEVDFAPTIAGLIEGALTIASNDADQPQIEIALQGTGLIPPVIAVEPQSLTSDLFSGDSQPLPVLIRNLGGSDLTFALTIGSASGPMVVERSPEFAGEPLQKSDKDPSALPSPVDPADLFTFAARQDLAPGDISVSAEQPLEQWLGSLSARFESVTSLIPNRFDFSEGDTGSSIGDGGGDMYDGGNYLSFGTGYLPYTAGQIESRSDLGGGGRYFTKKLPGLFVFAADIRGPQEFSVSGNLGADGYGSADGSVLRVVSGGQAFLGFVKRVFNAYDPSVNHLIIVRDTPGIGHEFSTDTNSDYQRVSNLGNTRRVYFLLMSARNGQYIDDATMLGIMRAFLALTTPAWLSATPESGTIPAGGTAELTATISAAGLIGGEYRSEISVSSNDPLTPVVSVPVSLHVTGVPRLSVRNDGVAQSSIKTYAIDGASTYHFFTLEPPVASPAAVLTVSAQGDFGDGDETATVSFEGTQIGQLGASGTDCTPVTLTIPLDPQFLQEAAQDGTLEFVVTNSALVSANCSTNRHSLSLTIDPNPDRLDFGSIFVGEQSTRTLTVANPGSENLLVSSIEPSDAALSVSPTMLQLEPGGEGKIRVTFAPDDVRDLEGTLVFSSNDQVRPTLSFPVQGSAKAPPRLEFTPAELAVSLPALGTEERSIRIKNRGGSDLRVGITSSIVETSRSSAQTALATGPASYRPQQPEDAPGIATLPIGDEQRQQPVLPLAGFSFYDGFEDQSLAPWVTRFFPASITAETAAAGTRYSVRIDGGADQHSTGAYLTFSPAQPSYVGFWIRTSSNTSNTAYFVLRDSGGRDAILFSASSNGRLYMNGDVGGDNSVPYTPGTWYHIEYKDIDFTNKQFDYYVDGALIRAGVPMRYSYLVSDFQMAEIYNYNARTSWWDEIVIGDDPRPEWLQFQPNQLTVPPGGYADLTVRLDAGNLDQGDFNANLTLATNDPTNRLATIPVLMHVIGVPDIALSGDYEERTSALPHFGRYSITTHPFSFDEIPASDVVVAVAVTGDYGTSSEYASVAVDGFSLGTVGRSGADCDTSTAEFVIRASKFAELIADGVVEVTVANSGEVDTFCANPVHRVTLVYRRPVSALLFERMFTGESRSRSLTVSNLGVEPLTVSSLRAGSKEVVATPSTLLVPPRNEQQVQLTFAPLVAGPLQDMLTIESDDPDEPQLTAALSGQAIAPPQIRLSQTSLYATLLPDDVIALPIDIANAGGSGLLIDSKAAVPVEPLPDDATVAEPLRRSPDRVLDDMSSLSDANAPVPAELRMPDAKVLLIEDRFPYFTRANEDALTAAELAYDRIQSVSLASWPLGSYRLVIVAGDQTTEFYQTIANSMPRLEAWVSSGGTLQFHGASWGLFRGDPSVVVLPGGVTTSFEYSDLNRVNLPGHRFMVDVPLEFAGYPASTALIAGTPPAAELVCVNDFGSPTLAVYPHGLGDVVVSTQTLERAYASYYPHRPILENLIKSGAGGLIRWLSFAPSRAIVAAGQSLQATTTLSAVGLPPDRYQQSLTLSSNDPLQPTSTIQVQLDVVRLQAKAGGPQQLECEGHDVATAQLQATASRHMDGFGAIERFEWSEHGATIAQGATVSVPLAVGSHELQLAIFDAIADTSTDSVHLDVLDTTAPSGGFTYPAPAQCLGPGALPVTARDNFADVCSGANVSRSYDRPGGAVFNSHGDQSVSMTVRDPYGNTAAPVSLAFTIDTKPPVTKILFDPSRWTFPRMIPFQQTFSAHDNDGATGLVVRERILVDGCVFYDGNAYGDNDGLLLDETLPATEDELCRLKRLCRRTVWNDPVITVEATDCAGNVSTSRKTKPGAYNANRCP